MRSFLLGVLLLPALAFAQPVTVEKTIPCDKAETVIETLTKQFGEQPIWMGKSKDSKVAILVNTTKNTWSVIQFNDTTACVLEVGEGFQINTKVFGSKNI